MKLFEIQPGAKIIEPPITGRELPVVYLGQKYLALLTGEEMPEGTEGLVEVDWQADPDICEDAAAQLAADAGINNMEGSSLSVYNTLTAPSADEQQEAFIAGVREEVARRILAQASLETQINLVSAATTDMLTEEQMTAYRAGLAWITQVRATGATLVANDDQNYADDANWPDIPADAAELAARF